MFRNFFLIFLLTLPACDDFSSTPSTNVNDDNDSDTDSPYTCPYAGLVDPALKPAIFQNCQKVDDTEVNSAAIDWSILKYANSTDLKYNGVGYFDLTGGCTGSLLDVDGADTAPAYVLTNGHCVGIHRMDTLVLKDSDAQGGKIIFNFFQDATSSQKISISTLTVLYGSMNHTDFAIVQLDATVGELKNLGIHSYKLSTEKPSTGQKIILSGIPQNFVSDLNVRKSFCYVLGEANVHEGKFVFSQSIVHQCSMVGGNSGSPIFDTATGMIVGLANTAVNDDTEGEIDCALDRPCEVQANNQAKVIPEHNYGQYVDEIAQCFSNGIFDLNTAGCTLE